MPHCLSCIRGAPRGCYPPAPGLSFKACQFNHAGTSEIFAPLTVSTLFLVSSSISFPPFPSPCSILRRPISTPNCPPQVWEFGPVTVTWCLPLWHAASLSCAFHGTCCSALLCLPPTFLNHQSVGQSGGCWWLVGSWERLACPSGRSELMLKWF